MVRYTSDTKNGSSSQEVPAGICRGAHNCCSCCYCVVRLVSGICPLSYGATTEDRTLPLPGPLELNGPTRRWHGTMSSWKVLGGNVCLVLNWYRMGFGVVQKTQGSTLPNCFLAPVKGHIRVRGCRTHTINPTCRKSHFARRFALVLFKYGESDSRRPKESRQECRVYYPGYDFKFEVSEYLVLVRESVCDVRFTARKLHITQSCMFFHESSLAGRC
ncbi:uncharacterized protein B0T23DRAFT_389895 [Neurospora hispaniola]|uniref:Uncharacterized protein n=1 Tax=Neurospora hispaniola TaxID=588809 RepID=A0AAJ0HZ20_9PEZI|nr:hypothetical protein B0T23DRAFT_389895 [Neurospora hispaniola]